MIPFETWLEQMVGYARLIGAGDKVRDAWVHRDTSKTSVTSFDELIEQIYDDLDSDTFASELEAYLPNAPEACRSLSVFLEALRRVEKIWDEKEAFRDPKTLLESGEWGAVKHAASRVVTDCSGFVKSSG